MNFLYLTVVFAACAYGMVVENSDWHTRFETIVKERCAKNSKNPDAYHELETAVETLPECVMEGVGDERPDITDDLEGFCTLLKKTNAVSCLTSMGKKMSACLAEEEQYLPDFMNDLYTLTVDTICGAEEAEKVKKLISTVNDNLLCFDRNDLRQIIVNKCSKKTKIMKMIEEEDYIMTKEDLCSDIETVKSCAIEALHEQCTEDPTEFVTLIFRPAIEACSK